MQQIRGTVPRNEGRVMATDGEILSLRGDCPQNGMSCVAIASKLGIPEHQVWACLRRNGRQGTFRAYQRNRGEGSPSASSGPRYQPVIYALQVERWIKRHGELQVDETVDGLFIASFGDVPGVAQETIGAAIRDAAEAAEVDNEEADSE